MKIPDGLSCSVTPEQIYRDGTPEIPDGYEFVRFGVPHPVTEFYLNFDGYIFSGRQDNPRIIVRKKPQPHEYIPWRWLGKTEKADPGAWEGCRKCSLPHVDPIHIKKPRRWVVEFHYDENCNRQSALDYNGKVLTPSGNFDTVKVIREVKPITLKEVELAMKKYGASSSGDWLLFLDNLGIEVED